MQKCVQCAPVRGMERGKLLSTCLLVEPRWLKLIVKGLGLGLGLGLGDWDGDGKWEMGNREYPQSQEMTV